jgi:hypothetical protein
MSRRVKRGPVKLNEDDEVIPAHEQDNQDAEINEEEVSVAKSPSRSESSRQSQRQSPQREEHPVNAGTWGTWFSNLATKTAQGFDKLYEMANQPVPLGREHVDIEEEDRKAAAASLNDIIRRAQPGRSVRESPETSELQTSDAHSGSAKLNSPPTEDYDQEQKQSYLSRLGKTTIGIYSKARDHWQQQLSAVDDNIDRSVDDAFKLYGGAVSVDSLQKKGQGADRAVRQKLRSMTPKQSSAFSNKLKGVEDSFDSEKLLESVEYIEESDIGGLISSVLLDV